MPPRNGIIAEIEKAGLSLNKPHSVLDKRGIFVADRAFDEVVNHDILHEVQKSETVVETMPEETVVETMPEETVVETIKIDEKRLASKRKKS